MTSNQHAEVPVERRDGPWLDAYAAAVCGPLEMPSTDDLRQAVTALVERFPDSRLTWRLDSTRRRWVNDRAAASIVTDGVWDEDMPIGQHLDGIIGDPSLSSPLSLVRYPNHLGVRMSHGLGDARLFVTVIAVVLHSALTGELIPWPAESGAKFPLISAAWRTFGRHPRAVGATIADRRANRIVAAQELPVVLEPWSPSRRTINITMPREQGDEIIAWGREFAPTATRFGLQVAIVLRALRRVGVDVSDDVRLVVDLRKYLAWRYIDGNLVAGVSMQLDPTMSPDLISSKVKATIRSGRPLAGHLVASMYGFTATPEITSVNVNGRPRVTFTDIGHQPVIDSLPFLPDSPIVWSASVLPEGPLGLTVMTGETQRLMGVVTTFHDNAIDAELVERAMNLVKADPIGLLSGGGVNP